MPQHGPGFAVKLSMTISVRTLEHHARSQRGFSLVDMLAVMAVMGIVGSMATMQVGNVRRSMQGDGAMRIVMSQLNSARELAITQRRNMEVRFVGANWLEIVRNDVPSGTTVLTKVALEGNARYALVDGVTDDTPDAFGNGTAISFGTATKIMFAPDGTLIDNAGSPLNGTVFLSVLNVPTSFRAVTVLGATGRVRSYRWNGAVWTRV
jgi:prepilin-type N-terminal cleavage/methylation domain-containing protein